MQGLSVDRLLLGVVGLMLLLILFATLRRSPKIALVAWLGTIFFVPVWIGQTLYAYFPAFMIIGLLAALSLLPTPLRVRPTRVDLIFTAVLILVPILYIFGLTTRSATFDLIFSWGTAYAFGRLVVHVVDAGWIYGAFSIVGAVAGLLSVLEFASGKNFFVTYLTSNSPLYDFWGTLQGRGSVIRAEGAFGHSIALGITLGISAGLALASRFKPGVRAVLAACALAGAAVTFSRSGILTAVLAVAFICLFARRVLTLRFRVGVLVFGGLAAAVSAGPLIAVFNSSDEAEGSALYRTQLLGLVQSMRPLGITSDFTVTTSSQVSVGAFRSIDNAMLLLGLLFGWVPLLCVLLCALGAVFSMLRGRATPATIVVVAQLPAVVTVAFITQYAAVAWFTVGLAVGSQAVRETRGRSRSHFVLEHQLPRMKEERSYA